MKNKVLNLLRNNDEYISGEYISEVLGVSRNSVWKHINNLKKDGYIIDAIRNKGYKIIKTPDNIDFNSVSEFLNTKRLGRNYFYYKELDSTNIKAKEIAQNNDSNFSVVTSEIQTKGTGRFNRVWQSPKGGIWTSLILKPNIAPNQANKITLIAAASVFKVLSELNIPCKIKWPNDVYINNKKFCGILTLMNCDMDTINHIIVGVGMNINISRENFTSDLNTATSLLIEKNIEYNRSKILASFLNNFENFYDTFINKNDLSEVISICRDNSLLIDMTAKLITPRNTESVTCLGIDDEGELIIKDSFGNIKKVISGEITFKNENTQ